MYSKDHVYVGPQRQILLIDIHDGMDDMFPANEENEEPEVTACAVYWYSWSYINENHENLRVSREFSCCFSGGFR